MCINTIQREDDCIWESHQQTIDLQYLIAGSEIILWDSTENLKGPMKTLVNPDRQEWISIESRSEHSMLRMMPGNFAMFLPNEAHCPMIAAKNPEQIKKVVVKIPSYLIQI